jgi:hypothetical protein
MSLRKVKRIAIVITGVLATVALSVAILFALLASLFFAATSQSVELRIEGTVHDRDTGRPVPGCLLSFVQVMGITPGYDDRRSNTRTDAAGRDTYAAFYSHSGPKFFPYAPRDPKVRIYIGEAPRYGRRDDVETWEVTLRFREPWRSGREVIPQVDIQRFMGHDEILNPPKGERWRKAGLDPLPTGPGDAKAEARVSVGEDGKVPVYRIVLDLYLTGAQIMACQAPARP